MKSRRSGSGGGKLSSRGVWRFPPRVRWGAATNLPWKYFSGNGFENCLQKWESIWMKRQSSLSWMYFSFSLSFFKVLLFRSHMPVVYQVLLVLLRNLSELVIVSNVIYFPLLAFSNLHFVFKLLYIYTSCCRHV